MIRVHLKGHFAPAHVRRRALARARQGRRSGCRGRIINTASESGLYGLAGQINYAAAKAGIASMTIVLGRELQKYGVTVNAIAPRARTRMTETVLARHRSREDGEFDEWDPDNIAPVVVWLASDDAADVSGQVFVVFGDRVHLMDGLGPRRTTVETDGRWTVDRAEDAQGRAVRRAHSTGSRKMGFGS